jgi:penicillin-binding protein 2
MKKKKDKSKKFTRRAFFLLFCKTILLSILGINFYRLQVLSSSKYKLLSDKNRIRINILNAPRGLITDRNGEIIVTNAFTYNVTVDTTQDIDFIINEIKTICNNVVDISKIDKRYQSHITICSGLNWEQVAKIEGNIKVNNLVKINQSYRRVYKYGQLLSYITGYTGIPSKEEVAENDIKKDLLVGKNGIEMTLDETLQGIHGTKKVEVNAFNRIVREISFDNPIQGETVKTTIDIGLQRKIAEINDGRKGIYIVMDVTNGEILAIYSTPGYDPNLFTDGIKYKDWNRLINDIDKPLVNRAISSLYPPGSTFKMMTLLAIFNSGISPEDGIYCNGEYKIGNRILHCWKKYGHGYVNGYNALEHSCNIYFGAQSIKCGINSIANIARKFGLGDKSGIELPFEASGLIPDKAWKMKKYSKPWTFGDTVNVSIGQGYILTTPIQIVTMAARIASGTMVSPTIVQSKGRKAEVINIKYLNIIGSSMYNVMKNHHWEGLGIAGKTGTAQVISKRDAKGKYGDHSLFVGYGPYDKPKYAVISIVENAGWGSETALPITKDIFRELFRVATPTGFEPVLPP